MEGYIDVESRVGGLAGRVSLVLTGTTCGQLCRPSWVQVSYMFQRGRCRPKPGATCLRASGLCSPSTEEDKVSRFSQFTAVFGSIPLHCKVGGGAG